MIDLLSLPIADFATSIGPAAVLYGLYSAYNGYKNRNDSRDAANQAYDAERYATDANTAIAEANMAMQEEQFAAQMEWAKELRAKEELGGTNEFNDRMYFDDQLGWITDLSQGSQRVSEAGRRQDQLNRTVIDANNRAREQRLVGLQGNEGLQADQLASEFNRSPNISGSEIGDITFAASGANRNALLDALGEQQFTQQLRYGDSSNASKLVGAQATAAADVAQGDLGNATLARLQGGEGLTNQRRNAVLDSYNNSRDKSVQAWNPQFSPVTAKTFGNRDTSGSTSAISNAFGNAPGDQSYIPTNYAEYNRSTANNASNNQLYNDLAKFGLSAYGQYKDGQVNRQTGDSTPSSSNTSQGFTWDNGRKYY